MTRKNWWMASCASLALVAMLQPTLALAAEGVAVQPKSSDLVARYAKSTASEPVLSHDAKLALLKKKVKYVFVLFQENRAFDFYFGTFPGVDGLFSKPASMTPGFNQPIVNTDGTVGTISPFLIPQTVTDVNGKTVQIYPADTDSVDHSHAGINNSMDVDANLKSRNDRYALNEEGLTTANGQIVSLKTHAAPTANPTLVQKQRAELVMGHVDCTTAPFLWQYADRFVLFDHFFQTVVGPSTPGALAILSGQSGATQWALHPGEGSNNSGDVIVASNGGMPVINDAPPYPGSALDQASVKPTYGSDQNPNTPAFNQTYASLPLSFMGSKINSIIEADENPALDLLDVQDDIKTIASKDASVAWGWYQQGYDHEPTDGTGAASHNNYIMHHNGAQYFGYLADNTKEQSNLHGLGDFYADMAAKRLPEKGGVFYVRGGYGNNDGQLPVDPNPTVQKNLTGNDDHPGYSDLQISESLLADEINTIAASPYWKDSAIVITYDETDGLYDHDVPHIRSLDPEGNPLSDGPRIPALVISPYAKAHAVDGEVGDHNSVIKLINELFGLVPLAELPDEQKGFAAGKRLFGQNYLGPADAKVGNVTDMLSAFDTNRLMGTEAPLPASYAMIPAATVQSLPHYGTNGCYVLNIVPTDYQNGVLVDPAPADFNPRPGTTPGTPTSGTWTP